MQHRLVAALCRSPVPTYKCSGRLCSQPNACAWQAGVNNVAVMIYLCSWCGCCAGGGDIHGRHCKVHGLRGCQASHHQQGCPDKLLKCQQPLGGVLPAFNMVLTSMKTAALMGLSHTCTVAGSLWPPHDGVTVRGSCSACRFVTSHVCPPGSKHGQVSFAVFRSECSSRARQRRGHPLELYPGDLFYLARTLDY